VRDYHFPSMFTNQFFPRRGTPAAKLHKVPTHQVVLSVVTYMYVTTLSELLTCTLSWIYIKTEMSEFLVLTGIWLVFIDCQFLVISIYSVFYCAICTFLTARDTYVICWKLKFGSDSLFKNWTVQKFDICSDDFPLYLNCMQSTIQIKVKEVALLAVNVQVKNILKHDWNRV